MKLGMSHSCPAQVERALGLDDPDDEAPILLHARGNAGLRTYAKLLERLRRSPHAKAAARLRAGKERDVPNFKGPSRPCSTRFG